MRMITGALLAVLAAGAALAQPDAASDHRCTPDVMATLSGWDATGLERIGTDADERVLLEPDPEMIEFDAGDGDDVVYLVDPPGGQTITGGPGSDTLVLCALSDLAISFKFADETAGGWDKEADRLVLEPSVFLGIPEGFERWVVVYGITPENDRIELRLPPGVAFAEEHGGARAGSVVIRAYPGRASDRIDADIFAVVPSPAPDPPPPTPDVAPALAAYDRSVTCSNPVDGAAGRTDGRYLRYSQLGETVDTTRVPGDWIHDTLDGDDLVYMRGSQTLFTGRGADQIMVCALDDPLSAIALGRGGSVVDLEPDTVIVEAGVFQDGMSRELRIDGLSPVNDRVVLRVPEGFDAEIRVHPGGLVQARIGDLTLTVPPGGLFGGAANSPASFVVERVGPASPTFAAATEAPDVAAFHCGDLKPHAAYAERRTPEGFPWSAGYSDGDDEVLIGAIPGIIEFETGGGDDHVYFDDPLAGTTLTAGRGADVLVVCRMRDLSLAVAVGDVSHSPDRDPDAVILEPEAFLAVPEGAMRRIDVFGVVADTDRVVLRLPRDLRADIHDTGVGAVIVSAGRTRVTLHRADDWMGRPLPEETIVVEESAVRAASEFEAMSGPPLAPLACADTSSHGYATPIDARRTDVKSAHFSTGDDRLLIDGDPGFVLYHALDGDDRALVTDTIANQQIHLGRGADSVTLCGSHEIGLHVDVGPHDAFPDTVVLEPGMFADPGAGLVRHLIVSGIVPGSDRVVLRPPPGLEPRIRGGTVDTILEATVGSTSLMVVTTGHLMEDPVDPASVLITSSSEAPTSVHPVRSRSSAPAIAASPESWSSTHGGDGRQAVVMGSSGTVLALACSKAGEPRMALYPEPAASAAQLAQAPVFRLAIGRRSYELDFRCGAEGGECMADSPITDDLLSALRRGSRLVVETGTPSPEQYTLRGSSAAIGALGSCTR